MKTYKMLWIDSYNSANWTKKQLRDAYPVKRLFEASDGWWDCEHELKIEATDIKDLAKKVWEYLDNESRIIEVFSVMDGKEVMFTEEDIEDYLPEGQVV